MSLIDKIIKEVSPKLAAKRAVNKYKVSVLEKRRYESAGMGRRNPAETQDTTPNTAVGDSLLILRARSVEMLENNGPANQAQRVVRNNVVGSGIRPSLDLEDPNLEIIITKRWKYFAEHHSADWDEREPFYGLQSMVIRTVFETGEAIIRRKRSKDGFSLQVQEGNYLDLDKNSLDSKHNIQHGIERNAKGKITHYWLFDNLEDDGATKSLESKRIPAKDVIHVFYAKRAGQRRGLPWLSPVMTSIRDVKEYQDAELIAKKVSACNAGFVTNSSEGITGITQSADLLDRMEPGMIEYLAPGEEITFNQPAQVIGYREFVSTQDRASSAGIGVMYQAMANDLTDVNFSSYRAGHIEQGANCEEWQERVMKLMNNRVWEWFMEDMIMKGIIKEPIRVSWTPPRRAMLDPLKESQGIENMLRMGLISWSQAVREQGRNPDEVLEEMKRDVERLQAAGVPVSWNEEKEPVPVEDPEKGKEE